MRSCLHPPARSRIQRAAAAVAAALALSGCGGGLYIGWGGGTGDDPSVSLVASVGAAAPGQTLQLSAAASGPWPIRSVQFLRLEADGSRTLLGSDTEAPYRWDAVMPATGAAEVRYLARATDSTGAAADSEAVVVRVLR